MINLPSKVDRTTKRTIDNQYSLRKNLKKIDGMFDLVICSSGYEDRTFGFLRNACEYLRARNTLIFLYRPSETSLFIRNLDNLATLKEMLQRIAEKPPQISEIDPVDPWSFREKTKEMIRQFDLAPGKRVLIDITSFTRVFLYEIIKSLYSSGCEFVAAYTEPRDYTDALPIGVSKLVIAPSFIGKPRASNKSFLLLFCGWETGRSKDTFDTFNSDDHIGVIGIEPIDKKHITWQNESYKRNKDLLSTISDVRPCPTLEFESILEFIEKVYEEKTTEFNKRKEKHDFAITGFGPKVQNLAICIFALKHKDVQLVYGAPTYWGASSKNENDVTVESKGIGASYLYGPFGSTK